MRRHGIVRLLIFGGACALLVLVYLFLLSAFRGKLGPWSPVLPAMVLATGLMGLNRRFLRAEGWSLAAIGLDRRVRFGRVALGVASGFLLVGLWLLILLVVVDGELRHVQRSPLAAIAGGVLFLVLNNLAEELAYRAYAFLAIRRLWGATPAVLVTSAVFALLHIQSGIPWLNAILVVLPTAVLYASLFLRFQNIWLVCATHVATNVAQELVGIRRSALTLFEIHPAVPISASQGRIVLVAIGAVTVAAAAAVLLRKPSNERVAESPSPTDI